MLTLSPTLKTRINLAELQQAEALMPAAVVRTAPLAVLHARRWAVTFDNPQLAEETEFIER